MCNLWRILIRPGTVAYIHVHAHIIGTSVAILTQSLWPRQSHDTYVY